MIGFSKIRPTKSKRKHQNEWNDSIRSKSMKLEENQKETIWSRGVASEREGTSSTEGNVFGSEENNNWLDFDSEPDEEEDAPNETNGLPFDNNCTNFNDALNQIASIFIQHNVSRGMAKDIFRISSILKVYSSMTICQIEKRISEWGFQETRIYSFCAKCSSMLDPSKKCRNKECSRFNVCQANVSSQKTILTFSIRKQIETLLSRGAFDISLLNRLRREASLSSRTCDTPKYKRRVEMCEKKHPYMITLFISLNCDGFRKRGCSRGEIWPVYLAAHDITSGEGSYREYRPEVVILASMMKSCSKLTTSDFQSLFQRMKIEIEETTNDPLKVNLNGVQYDVRLELFQSILDLDACRKIHGLPIWQSYSSCSLCNVTGTQVKTKKGRKICWVPENGVTEYTESFPPPKILKSSLPPPFTDGFDGLHIIFEGTSRDLLKDLLGGGHKLKAKIKKRNRSMWAIALDSGKSPRGRGSASLLDPIQLSTRTGTEVQELYDLAVPTLISIMNSPSDWIIMILLHWICTRLITDWHLSVGTCESIDKLVPILKDLVGTSFITFYSMKFHFMVDHMAPKIRDNGSPLLSSAAPFERLNQTLGRSSNPYTTRTMFNISKRFLALKNTVKVDTKDTAKARYSNFSANDSLPLTKKENLCILSYTSDDVSFRSTFSDGKRSFGIRRSCIGKPLHNCFVYFKGKKKQMEYGSIERIFLHNTRCMALIQQFQTVDPFEPLYKHIVERKYPMQPKNLFSSVNSYYRKIMPPRLAKAKKDSKKPEPLEESRKSYLNATPSSSGVKRVKLTNSRVSSLRKTTRRNHYEEIKTPVFKSPLQMESLYPDLKPYDLESSLKPALMSDDEESYEDEEENEQPEMESDYDDDQVFLNNRKNPRESPRESQFSISQHLGHTYHEEKTVIEKLTDAISRGSPFELGYLIREGFSSNTLTELQLETKWSLQDTRAIDQLKASVNSLASSFINQTSVSLLTKRTLCRNHVIGKVENFPAINLVEKYDELNLIGDNAYSQMTYFLTRVFKNVLRPKFFIWLYTYRPRCVRPTDKHFIILPKEITEVLIDFAYDVVGVYLPDDLLHGHIDPNHKFLEEIGNDAEKEIERRRSDRERVAQTMQNSIGQMLNYLRDYHFDVDTGELESCKVRNTCLRHLSWKDLKLWRERCRSTGEDENKIDPVKLLGFYAKQIEKVKI